MRRFRVPVSQGVCCVLALTALLLLTISPAVAELSSSKSSSSSRSNGSRDLGDSNSGSSSRSSRSSSSRRSDSDDSDVDDGGDSRSSRSRSSSRRSGSSRSSSSSKGGTIGGSGSGEPPPIVFGAKWEREGIRPRGNLISAAVFNSMPCGQASAAADGSAQYQCGDRWYQRVDHEGWTCYSEIYPPAGTVVASLPRDAQVIGSDGRVLFATDDAFYAVAPNSSGYVVVEPKVGERFDRLPDRSGNPVPVVVNGVEYYRHFGVFYREEVSPGGTSYRVSASPYATPAALPNTDAPPSTPTAAPPIVAWGATEHGSATDFPPATDSPRGAFIGSPSAQPPRVLEDVPTTAPVSVSHAP